MNECVITSSSAIVQENGPAEREFTVDEKPLNEEKAPMYSRVDYDITLPAWQIARGAHSMGFGFPSILCNRKKVLPLKCAFF